jgi:MFS transporter, DHA3 family, macrolide efflux protein
VSRPTRAATLPLPWLWVGQVLSNLGTQASLYGLGVWLLRQQQSLLPLVVVAVGVQLSKTAVLPWIAPRLSHWPWRLVLLRANTVAAMATLSMAALLVWARWPPLSLLPLLAVAAAAEAVLVLALATLLPAVVAPPKLPQVNGWLITSDALVQVCAPALGAAVVATGGVGAVVGLDAVTFAAGMGCVALVNLPPWNEPPSTPVRTQTQPPQMWGTVLQLWRARHTRTLLGASMALSFVLACTEVVFPAWVIGAMGTGWLLPALLLNGLAYGCGTGLWFRLGDRHQLVPALLGWQGLMLLGAALPRIAQLPLLWSWGVVTFTAAVPVVLAALQGRWQRWIAPADQPRCFAARFAGEWLARLLGLLTAGLLVDAVFGHAWTQGQPEAWALATVGALLLAVVPWLR